MTDRIATLQKGLSKLEAERADKQLELEEARAALKRDGQRMEALVSELEDVKAALLVCGCEEWDCGVCLLEHYVVIL
jgi:predicted  nucleic acid-binding Zn-ribbon protein